MIPSLSYDHKLPPAQPEPRPYKCTHIIRHAKRGENAKGTVAISLLCSGLQCPEAVTGEAAKIGGTG